jgi:hypothetical protein
MAGGIRPQAARRAATSLTNNIEAEALGFHSTFAVKHHFTEFRQLSATLNLLTCHPLFNPC